jgi:protoheme IX farnesyltransferase
MVTKRKPIPAIAIADAINDDSQMRDYFALLKMRVMSLVVFTAWVGLMIAPGTIHPLVAACAILCTAIGSGAAGAINMWYDRDIDALMERTKNRPIPAGRIQPAAALDFATVLAVLSVMVMAVSVNIAAAVLLALAILYYVFIYTIWLKRSTPQNIVIGGAAGAFPPMIGWAAVTGNVSPVSWALFAIIFFWTCPHFWALALYRADDYKRAKVPMLPVVAGIASTKRHIVGYTILTILSSYAPVWLGAMHMQYLWIAHCLNLFFAWFVFKLWRNKGIDGAKTVFAYSIFYLFVLFTAMVIDHTYARLIL